MATISAFMGGDHRDCDELFVELESAASEGDWDAARSKWARFEPVFRRHLSIEEEVLFPAIETATGMQHGPTDVMRAEHDQMRALLGPLDAALRDGDTAACLGLAESMLVLIQQHNMKEEQVLYPMADQALQPHVLQSMRERMDSPVS